MVEQHHIYIRVEMVTEMRGDRKRGRRVLSWCSPISISRCTEEALPEEELRAERQMRGCGLLCGAAKYPTLLVFSSSFDSVAGEEIPTP
jgi:hypothetical protein